MAKKNTQALGLRMDDIMLEATQMFGPKMNFTAAEAYKLLRTNITFSFPGEGAHQVFGITSSLRGEGKSLTALNTAYSLAEIGKEVLLIEGDMRMPTMARRLELISAPGLSNLLVGLNSVRSAVQNYKAVLPDGKELTFDVIVSGDVPPNPSELLASERFAGLLGKLREHYDYIVLDLPPVTAVTDAVIASRLVDGMLVVVREGIARRSALKETMRQLQMVDAHIIGFVYNGVKENGTGYNRYTGDYYFRHTQPGNDDTSRS